jgi:hypothetical protein
MLKQDIIIEASKRWSSGQTLEAGRILYEYLPNNQRPLWAARILAHCLQLIRSVREIDTIYEIAMDKTRWKEAHEAFGALRELTLKAERSKSNYEIYAGILSLAENTAKVAYNASGEAAPFDHNAGWRIISNLRHIVDKVKDVEFEVMAWETATEI